MTEVRGPKTDIREQVSSVGLQLSAGGGVLKFSNWRIGENVKIRSQIKLDKDPNISGRFG